MLEGRDDLAVLWDIRVSDDYKHQGIGQHLFDLAISKDLKQIEKDYYFIIDKIKQGKAHELSEADTMYLGACTKGTDSNDLRKQVNDLDSFLESCHSYSVGYDRLLKYTLDNLPKVIQRIIIQTINQVIP